MKTLKDLSGTYFVKSLFPITKTCRARSYEIYLRFYHVTGLTQVALGIENHLYHKRWAPLIVTFLLRKCINCVLNGRYANVKDIIARLTLEQQSKNIIF